MKKKLLALALAGLLALSATSCLNKEAERPDGPIGGTTNNGGGPGTPTTVTWTDVNETVYATAGMTLTGVDNASDVSSVQAMDVLTRVKIGTNGKSVVIKNDKYYYATSRNLTTEDLEGLNFTPCNETMYVAVETLNIRRYASNASYSNIEGALKLNDTVTVIAKGTSWCKIDYKGAQRFVHLDFLSASKVIDPNDLTQYPTFVESAPTTQYVTVENVSVRQAPSTAATALGYLKKDDTVTVVASTVINGKTWHKVMVVLEVKEGQSPEAIEAYISADCLSPNKGATSAMTLDGMLKLYPDFTETNGVQTRYITDNVNIRSTPKYVAVDDKNSNVVQTLKKADLVKVVAVAKNADADNIMWAMIEYKEGEYYFVSVKYLTTDPSGNPAAPTLADLLATYQNFSACTEKTVWANGLVYCNTTPTNDTEITKQLSAGDAVTVVASGSTDKYGLTTWYIFRTAEGEYYFANASLFTDVAPAPAA